MLVLKRMKRGIALAVLVGFSVAISGCGPSETYSGGAAGTAPTARPGPAAEQSNSDETPGVELPAPVAPAETKPEGGSN